jgi:putative transposase
VRVVVHAADISDRDGAKVVLAGIGEQAPTLRHLWLDAGYQGETVSWIEQDLGLSVTVVRKPRRWIWWPADQEPPPLPAGFQVLPRRWVVERTFAWLGRYRRLSKDYEALPATEEAWIHLAMSCLMLARLAP